MSDHLPDDVRRWPDDPYALLGIDSDVDARTARLAYTRLIRRFKPEHFPEEFRRLRTAYETVQSHLQWQEWRSASDSDETTPAAVSPSADAGSDDDDDQTAFDHAPLRAALRPDLEVELSRAWRPVAEGSLSDAYRRLAAVCRRFGPSAGLALREYWLLKIEPSLDAGRSRLAPLAEAFSYSQSAGPAMELLRREWEASPEEALDDRFARLLSPEDDHGLLADLLPARWRAAGRREKLPAIVSDVNRFRPVFATSDESTWARLLLAAADELAWSNDKATVRFFKEVCSEAFAIQHVHFELGHLFDRLDLLIEIAKGWRILKRDGTEPLVVEFVRQSWSRPPAEYRGVGLELARALIENPRRGLRKLDRIAWESPAVVAQVQRALEACRSHGEHYLEGDGEDDECAREHAARFLLSLPWRKYRKIRRRLLDFCLASAISPTRLIALTAHQPRCHDLPGGEKNLADEVAADSPLHCVYLAWELSWT